MAKVKGIVAKVSGKSCILVTTQGEFIRVRPTVSPVSVGQEIEALRVGSASWRKTALAVAAVLVLSLIIPFYPLLTASAQPAAYVSLDINPSLELGVNRQGTVVETKGFNQAGTKLLDGSAVAKTNVYEALQKLLDQAVQQGFITKADSNLLVISFTGDGRYTFDPQKLKSLIEQQISADNLQAQVVITPATMAIHQQALAEQMSQGKLLVLQAAKAKGVELDLNNLKNEGIDQALEAKGIDMDQLETHVTHMGVSDNQGKGQQNAPPAKVEEKPQDGVSPGHSKDRGENDKVNGNKGAAAKGKHQSSPTMKPKPEQWEDQRSTNTMFPPTNPSEQYSQEHSKQEQGEH